MDLNATLLGEMITFAILVWFTMWIVWPLITAILDQRKKTIADGLAAAEAGRKLLASAEQTAQQKIQEAKQHCYKVLEQADIDANLILENARQQARKERDEIIASGHVGVERALTKAKQELQAQVVDLVVIGAEKVLQRSINPQDHAKILHDLAKNLA